MVYKIRVILDSKDSIFRDIEIKDKAAWDAAEQVADYEHGWSSDIETDFAPKGLNEDTVRFISAKKNEPEWMLDWRLKAFRHWQTMPMPDWEPVSRPRPIPALRYRPSGSRTPMPPRPLGTPCSRLWRARVLDPRSAPPRPGPRRPRAAPLRPVRRRVPPRVRRRHIRARPATL